jgi:hypothetical protein
MLPATEEKLMGIVLLVDTLHVNPELFLTSRSMKGTLPIPAVGTTKVVFPVSPQCWNI